MVSEIFTDFANEFKAKSAGSIHSSHFTEIIGKAVVDLNGEYRGITDNAQNFAYVRLNGPLTYSTGDRRISSCSDLENVVTAPFRLVVGMWEKNVYQIENEVHDILSRMDWTTIVKRPFRKVNLTRAVLSSEETAIAELKENPKWKKELGLLSVDGFITYLWTQSKCPPENCQ